MVEKVQVVLISKTFIKFEGIPRRYVEDLMNALETKGRSRVLNFLWIIWVKKEGSDWT
jgi:hypothetical protein